MSLIFLAPLFLLGIAAIAVPVIVHLVNRERRTAVAFPSLMFLRRVPFRSVRRQRIRHWALFALRCLALALLALAFARPFLDRESRSATASGAGPRELVVLLDRSYSMAYGDRWSRATAAAERAIAGMSGADQATLVLFDHEAVSAAGPTGDAQVVRSALRNAEPGAGSTRYAPALAVAQQLVDRAERPRREVVLISDFQRSGWDGQELPRLPASAKLTTIDVSDSTTTNSLVTNVDVSREARDGVDRATVVARVARQGNGSVTARATLELNGREIESKQITLPASGAASVTFSPVAVPDGPSRGTVRVSGSAGDDRLAADDAFHFTVARANVVNVLVIESPGAPPARTMFLSRALGIGDNPSFSVVHRRSNNVTAADVDRARVVFLHAAAMPSGAIADRIRTMVRSGGGLVVALGETAVGRAGSAMSEILPGEVGGIMDRSEERGGTMGSIDRNHPALESFRGARSGDFTSARYFRYRSLSPSSTDHVLARFDDGTVALAERRIANGRVLVFGSTFDGYWNDLPVQPVFLPLVQSLARHAAGYTPQRPWETVGQVLAVSDGDGDADLVAIAPSGQRTRWSEGDSVRSLSLREQGFYEVRSSRTLAADRVIAVNRDVTESELGTFAPSDLTRAVTSTDALNTTAANATTLSVAEREKRQTLWWYVLLLALILLAAESLLSNRLSRAPRRDVAMAEGKIDHA